MDAPSGDWIASADSDVHAVQNIGWLDNYTPHESQAVLSNGSVVRVAGVGQAVLVALSPGSDPNQPHDQVQIVLRQVLHVPTLQYNIIGCKANGWIIGRDWLADADGNKIADFDRSKSARSVNIRPEPHFTLVAPSRFGRYLVAPEIVSVSWPEFPRVLYTFRPYDLAELEWLEGYGGETAFLLERGIDVQDAAQTLRGVLVVRREMALWRENKLYFKQRNALRALIMMSTSSDPQTEDLRRDFASENDFGFGD